MALKPSPFRILGGDIIPTPVGDIQVQITSVPNPYEIQLELERIAANLQDVSLPLVTSARILAEDTQERFNTETDPDGNAWIPLDEEYLANKISLGYPEDILRRTGKLEKEAIRVSSYRVMDDGVFFDTSKLPSYGLLHQVGSGTENVGLASRHRFQSRTDEDYRRREGGSHTNLGIGTGKALPARPFLGMSEEAESRIWAAFDLWFDEATSIAINPVTGVVQQRLSSGQFGPKVVL